MKKLLAVMIVGLFVLGSGLALAKEMKKECPVAPDKKVEQKKEDWQAKRLDRMAKELNLTAEQKEKIAAIFKENDIKVKTVMDKAKKDMNAIRDTNEKQIKAVLTPEQAKKHDEMKAGMQKKMGGERGKGRMEMKERGRHGERPMMEEDKPMMEKK